jgi:hypothetical protein
MDSYAALGGFYWRKTELDKLGRMGYPIAVEKMCCCA